MACKLPTCPKVVRMWYSQVNSEFLYTNEHFLAKKRRILAFECTCIGTNHIETKQTSRMPRFGQISAHAGMLCRSHDRFDRTRLLRRLLIPIECLSARRVPMAYARRNQTNSAKPATTSRRDCDIIEWDIAQSIISSIIDLRPRFPDHRFRWGSHCVLHRRQDQYGRAGSWRPVKARQLLDIGGQRDIRHFKMVTNSRYDVMIWAEAWQNVTISCKPRKESSCASAQSDQSFRFALFW